jgi:hypothetical protein
MAAQRQVDQAPWIRVDVRAALAPISPPSKPAKPSSTRRSSRSANTATPSSTTSAADRRRPDRPAARHRRTPPATHSRRRDGRRCSLLVQVARPHCNAGARPGPAASSPAGRPRRGTPRLRFVANNDVDIRKHGVARFDRDVTVAGGPTSRFAVKATGGQPVPRPAKTPRMSPTPPTSPEDTVRHFVRKGELVDGDYALILPQSGWSMRRGISVDRDALSRVAANADLPALIRTSANGWLSLSPSIRASART